MKKFILATAALGALIAAPAFADGTNTGTDIETYTINGQNSAKCNIVTESATYDLPEDSISDSSGFVNAGLANAVATLLNSKNITAWCTGNSNSLVMTRSALTSGDGQLEAGFSKAAIYDMNVDIADATRAGGGAVLEGSSDGPGNGPGIGVGAGEAITRFGPTGAGTQLTFTQEGGTTVASLGNGANSSEAARSAYNEVESARLVAGAFTGTVTLTLTPGV